MERVDVLAFPCHLQQLIMMEWSKFFEFSRGFTKMGVEPFGSCPYKDTVFDDQEFVNNSN
jgi:hypothetical protein